MEIFKDKNGLIVTRNPDSPHFFSLYDSAHPEKWRTDLRFHERGIKEAGINGITDEALLEIVAHRLHIRTGKAASMGAAGVEHALLALRNYS